MPFRDMGRDFGIASDIADALTFKAIWHEVDGEYIVSSAVKRKSSNVEAKALQISTTRRALTSGRAGSGSHLPSPWQFAPMNLPG
jgi:hypothetical protein